MTANFDFEIDPGELGDLPVLPPRRRFADLLPAKVVTWFRVKFRIFPPTARERWLVSSFFLRIFYNTQRVEMLIDKTPKPFVMTKAPDEAKEYTPEGEWN